VPRNIIALLCAAFGTVAGLWPAVAYVAPIEIGILTCMLGPKSADTPAAEDVGEKRSLTCRFVAGEKAPGETYVGLLQIVGSAGKLADAASIVMVVRAPSSSAPSVGSIHQKYTVGFLAEGSSQPPALVGERDSSIVLHPLRAAGAEQSSLALGQRDLVFISLELRLATAPA
jgi:hypothetical protein